VIPWRFFLFTGLLVLILYLHFYLAHRQWRRLKGRPSLEIDVNYVRMEDCLPQSFRLKVKEWLQLPAVTVTGTERTILKGNERIRATGPMAIGDRHESDAIWVVDGDFSCGSGCEFFREIYARGSARIGHGSRLQSLAADGNATLDDGVTAARWLDSTGEMILGTDCRVGARVTSRTTVRLGMGSRVLSVFAPRVSTPGSNGSPSSQDPPMSDDLVEIPPPDESSTAEQALLDAGVDPKKVVRMSADSWSYAGDLTPSRPLRVGAKLIVKGRCHLPPRSGVLHDLKADGSLHIGRGGFCEGNLVAGGDIYLAPECRFAAVVHAFGSILVSEGTRGVGKEAPVVAYAGDGIWVENNVVICGKLASPGGVMVVDAAGAEDWRKRKKIQTSRLLRV
jgi:hypothetical protein